MPRSTPNKSLRRELSRAVGKVCSYLECGKIDEARQWATILQAVLAERSLLVDNRPRVIYDGAQPENSTTNTGASHARRRRISKTRSDNLT